MYNVYNASTCINRSVRSMFATPIVIKRAYTPIVFDCRWQLNASAAYMWSSVGLINGHAQWKSLYALNGLQLR
jgi:hypothetical protein